MLPSANDGTLINQPPENFSEQIICLMHGGSLVQIASPHKVERPNPIGWGALACSWD